jgi:carbonic anhydrase
MENPAARQPFRIIRRRELLAGLAGASLCGAFAPVSRAIQGHHDAGGKGPTPDQALQRLIDGNVRFTTDKLSHPHQDAATSKALVNSNESKSYPLPSAEGQSPFAVVVGCSDSRVSPELVFDQGLGDLFVVRVAGNVISAEVAGSVEYAVEHLHSPLVCVLGHQNCGAVAAALLPQADREKEAKDIQALLNRIQPALKDVDPHLSRDQRLTASIEANARQSMKVLAASPILSKGIADKSLRIVCGVYQLSTGKVNLLS